MTLAHSLSPLLPFFTLQKNHRRPSLPRPFEEYLIVRLKSLLPIASKSQPSISILWLTRAADVLSLTLSDVELLMSDPEVSESGKNTLGYYLDSSVNLLDASTAATAQIDSVLRRRLHLRLAIHHLSHGNAGKARSSLAKWDRARANKPFDLSELTPGDLPRGKISALGRAIYAVETLSYLVGATISAALAEETIELLPIRVSVDFPWADAFNDIVTALSGRKGLDELEDVETAVRRLVAAVDDVESEDSAVKVSVAADVVERATEELTEKFERLSGAVERMFVASLGTRHAALQCFRFEPKRSKEVATIKKGFFKGHRMIFS